MITGALGHIGSRFVRELPCTYPEAEIVMIDNLLTQRYCSLFRLPDRGDYRFIEMDVADNDLRPIVEGADVVIHLAAITDAASSFRNKEQVEQANYRATAHVAEACQEENCPMVFVSSTSVYGTQNKVVDEDCSPEELKPQSPYAETKLREENLLQTLGSSETLRFVICRFGTICGVSPGMRFHTAVNKFCWQAVMGQPITVWRTALHQKRPYLALSDAVEALNFIMKHGLFDQGVYNVLTENLTVQSIIRFIQHHIPQLDIQYVESEIMNQLSYEVSNRRFRDRGFEFTGSIPQGIGETIEMLYRAGGTCVR